MSLVHNLKLTISYTLTGTRTRLVSLLLYNLEASTSAVIDYPIMFSRAALLSSPFLPAALMGAFVTFSCDLTNLEIGPARWGALLIEGNVCNGQSSSPIAVEWCTPDRGQRLQRTK